MGFIGPGWVLDRLVYQKDRAVGNYLILIVVGLLAGVLAGFLGIGGRYRYGPRNGGLRANGGARRWGRVLWPL